jgi:hypothetical protein
MTRSLSNDSFTSESNMGAIMRSWESWMVLRFVTIVKGGKQNPLALNLSSQAQAQWTSSQTTTLDLYWLSIALKGIMGSMIRLVVH